MDVYIRGGVFLHVLKKFQPPASTAAFDIVAGISQALEFVQDQTRHNQTAAQKPGLKNIRDTPVDDGAGVQKHHHRLEVLALEAHIRDDEVEFVLASQRHDRAQIRKNKHQDHTQDGL